MRKVVPDLHSGSWLLLIAKIPILANPIADFGKSEYSPWLRRRKQQMGNLEDYFKPFRDNIVGYNQTFTSPYGNQRIVYADWTASGRLYKPIEDALLNRFGPFVGNTHSESTVTGTSMTQAYHEAHTILKKHVGAQNDDCILTVGNGMTAAVNKFQRILGLKAPERLREFVKLSDEETPVVFVTHMEHHSNQTSWLESIADVVIIPPHGEGNVDLDAFALQLKEYKHRKTKIGSFISCSNVTGAFTPYHRLARMIHEQGGVCFVDFAASAPYTPIDMHPEDPMERLDAIFFSPHKLLGGPGSAGVIVFNKSLYANSVPDEAGGGTVAWTNPWGQYRFIEDIETREDGGTPGFLQAIKAALAVKLKETMSVVAIEKREQEIVSRVLSEMRSIPRLHVLANNIEHRLAMFSFHVEDVHYNLMVRLLNDRFGVQARGGCSCAGTYGHFLLHVDPSRSKSITDKISKGDLSEKPGWVRLSMHPTMTNDEIEFCLHAVRETVNHADEWQNDYRYSSKTNEYLHMRSGSADAERVSGWFNFS
jgi:selenocysteine lyase/cysteine desulfurase